jgi:hypothetical protein
MTTQPTERVQALADRYHKVICEALGLGLDAAALESILTARPKATPTAEEIAEATSDAYSADRYTSWTACAKVLLGLGYDAPQTEAILRSKMTRWAADFSNKRYGKATSADLKRFMLDSKDAIDREVDEWSLDNVTYLPY